MKSEYNIKQEIVDLLKKVYKSNNEFLKFDEYKIDISLFMEKVKTLKSDMLFTFLKKTNQYVFEAIFYSSINYDDNQFNKSFNRFLIEVFETDEGNVEDIIFNSGYDEKEKIALAFICSKYNEYYSDFIVLYTQLNEVFESELKYQYDAIIKKCENINLNDIFLSSVVNQSQNLILCISDYRNIRFHQESKTVLYGISNLFQASTKEENYIDILKLLCDSTKYAILRELAIKKCYQRELASKLNLTTATISHHTSILLEKDILKSQLEKNKIFFSINYDKIELILQEFKSNLFLGK